MAVRGNHRILDHMPHDLAARDLPHLHLLPLRQQFAGLVFVAVFQGFTDTGEVVAELTKTQGDIQQGHIPQHSHPPAQRPLEQPMQEHGQQGGGEDSDAPSHPGLGAGARVEGAHHPSRPVFDRDKDLVLGLEGAGLLQQEGQQDGKKTHGVLMWMARPPEIGKNCAAYRPWRPR